MGTQSRVLSETRILNNLYDLPGDLYCYLDPRTSIGLHLTAKKTNSFDFPVQKSWDSWGGILHQIALTSAHTLRRFLSSICFWRSALYSSNARACASLSPKATFASDPNRALGICSHNWLLLNNSTYNLLKKFFWNLSRFASRCVTRSTGYECLVMSSRVRVLMSEYLPFCRLTLGAIHSVLEPVYRS